MANSKTYLMMILFGAAAVLAAGCSDDTVAPTADPLDTAPPAVPYLLRSTLDVESGTAIISWGLNTVDTDLAGYLVTRETDAEVVQLIDTPALVQSVEDPAPALGVSIYSVIAVDLAGNHSPAQQIWLNRSPSHLPGLDAN